MNDQEYQAITTAWAEGRCPECGTLPHYLDCPLLCDSEDCPCFYNATCPTDYQHKGDDK